MKKLLSVVAVFAAAILLVACGSKSKDATSKATTHNFTDDRGKVVKVPNDLKKVVVQTFPDEAITLGMNVVGTDQWSFPDPYLSKKQKGDMVDLGAPMNAEKIAEVAPDLIVTIDKDKVADYEKIAPTVYIEYNKVKGMDAKLDYFAKLFNAKAAEKKFLKTFDAKAAAYKAQLAKSGIKTSDSTISIIELVGNKIYAYGNDWGRGGQALTRGLGFKQSSEMQAISDGDGWKELNVESLADLSADYIFVDYAAADKSQYEALTKNPVWSQIKAVKAKQVVTMDYNKVYYFGGPTASEKLMKVYADAIIKQTK
ncbi:ABC transporter substrate-binding protein [Lactococcus insecticola]|uniref:Ferrichrome ABC transporter substrate-binding protein n=1 Tax=Pseudolactococcus insecticola TaxID=2709158 RepID=A0A6A0B9Q8_9LACT|nr:ABC transporter substrate-binding protein [Lactococcus insecticola]GFH40547.1 ferrichrome ABC transporter substrate-binding protein [Lactococcus insecticola]